MNGRMFVSPGGARSQWLAVAGLIALVCAGFSVSPAQAAYLGSEGRIAFVRSGNIYSIKPDGTKLAQLTTNGHDSGPRWSPNGALIAYLHRGNLWVMHANGSHQSQLTHSAPSFTDGRPSWSPSGRYIAFVRTARRAHTGYLYRYDTKTGQQVAFTTMVNGKLIKVPAVAGTGVAWQRALNASNAFGFFIAFEGAGVLCPPGRYCLDALGFGSQSAYKDGFPSSDDQTTLPTRLTEPDWYPIKPSFSTNVLTSVASCSGVICTHLGVVLSVPAPGPVTPILPGAYDAVFSPLGLHIAFVRNGRHGPRIYTALTDAPANHQVPLTLGQQPDWQPVAPFPPG